MCSRTDFPPYETPDKVEWTYTLSEEAVERRAAKRNHWEADIYGSLSMQERVAPIIGVMRRNAERWAKQHGYESGPEFWDVQHLLNVQEPRYRFRFRIVVKEPTSEPIPA